MKERNRDHAWRTIVVQPTSADIRMPTRRGNVRRPTSEASGFPAGPGGVMPRHDKSVQFRDPSNQPPPPSQPHQGPALSPTHRQQQLQLPQHPTLNPQGPTLNPRHQPPVLNSRRSSANHHHHQRCMPRTQPLSSHPTSQSQQRIGSQVLV